MKFAYPNALFGAIGNPFVEEKDISRIVESKDLFGFKESINNFKDYKIEGENAFEVQQSLDDHFIQTIKKMRKDSPKDMGDFYDAYLEKLDFYLVKNMLKNKLEGISNKDIKLDEATLDSTKEILLKIKDAEIKEISDILKEYGFEKEITDVISQEKVDFFTIDNEINKQIINKFKQVKVPYKCEEGIQIFIKRMIDVINIKNLLRAKQLGYDNESCKKLFLGEGQEIAPWKFKEMSEVDQVSQVISVLEGTSYYNILKDNIENYNKEDSVQILENALDGLFLKIIRDISTQYFISIGPTIRFLVSKEYEIQNLKAVAKGVDESLSSDIIKKFVVLEAKV
jgi:V/A-type H+-transporting ATPase subunit C